MNLNQGQLTSDKRKKGLTGQRGKTYNVINVQRGLQAPKTSDPRKSVFDSSSSSSDINWQGHNNTRYTASTPNFSRSYNTSIEQESKIIVAITEGRGEATCEVGIAAINILQPNLILCQIADTQSYFNVLTKINLLNPIEIIIPNTLIASRLTEKLKETFRNIKINAVPRITFNKSNGMQYVHKLCAPAWNSIFLILQHKYYALTATSALLTYTETHLHTYCSKESIKVEYQESEGFTIIDVFTADKLELVSCALEESNSKYSSLRGVLNHCVTKIGGRTLRASILQPPCNLPDIEERLDCVEELINNPENIVTIQTHLKQISNIDQLLTLAMVLPEQPQKVSARQLNYILLLNSLFELLEPLKELFANSNKPFFIELFNTLDCDEFTHLKDLVRAIIQDNGRPATGEQGNYERCFCIKPGINEVLDIIRKNYSEKLDHMREYVKSLGDEHLLDIKLTNNNKKGYHIVLTLTPQQRRTFKKSDLPAEFIQVQRLTTMITMKTIELISLSARLEDITFEILKISNILIYHLMGEIRKRIGLFYKLCEHIAKLDMLTSLAQASTAGNKYVRPKFGEVTQVLNSRHPLLEYLCDTEPSANDIHGSDYYNLHLVTGPNASGKSIYIRQIVLLQIMAQVGCFVPATYAMFRVADRIFARIYFEDNMDCGASSFVLEMKEIQYFLTSMTNNTLIIIDELCRSTCVEEGTALAMAICEKLMTTKAFIYCTTHYTFLTKLWNMYLNVKCWQLETKEIDRGERTVLKYTYNVIPGVTSLEGYAIYLARASWPKEIMNYVEDFIKILRAEKIREIAVEEVDPRLRLKYDLESDFKILKCQGQLFGDIIQKKLDQYAQDLQQFDVNISVEELAQNANRHTYPDVLPNPQITPSTSSPINSLQMTLVEHSSSLKYGNEEISTPPEVSTSHTLTPKKQLTIQASPEQSFHSFFYPEVVYSNSTISQSESIDYNPTFGLIPRDELIPEANISDETIPENDLLITQQEAALNLDLDDASFEINPENNEACRLIQEDDINYQYTQQGFVNLTQESQTIEEYASLLKNDGLDNFNQFTQEDSIVKPQKLMQESIEESFHLIPQRTIQPNYHFPFKSNSQILDEIDDHIFTQSTITSETNYQMHSPIHQTIEEPFNIQFQKDYGNTDTQLEEEISFQMQQITTQRNMQELSQLQQATSQRITQSRQKIEEYKQTSQQINSTFEIFEEDAIASTSCCLKKILETQSRTKIGESKHTSQQMNTTYKIIQEDEIASTSYGFVKNLDTQSRQKIEEFKHNSQQMNTTYEIIQEDAIASTSYCFLNNLDTQSCQKIEETKHTSPQMNTTYEIIQEDAIASTSYGFSKNLDTPGQIKSAKIRRSSRDPSDLISDDTMMSPIVNYGNNLEIKERQQLMEDKSNSGFNHFMKGLHHCSLPTYPEKTSTPIHMIGKGCSEPLNILEDVVFKKPKHVKHSNIIEENIIKANSQPLAQHKNYMQPIINKSVSSINKSGLEKLDTNTKNSSMKIQEDLDAFEAIEDMLSVSASFEEDWDFEATQTSTSTTTSNLINLEECAQIKPKQIRKFEAISRKVHCSEIDDEIEDEPPDQMIEDNFETCLEEADCEEVLEADVTAEFFSINFDEELEPKASQMQPKSRITNIKESCLNDILKEDLMYSIDKTVRTVEENNQTQLEESLNKEMEHSYLHDILEDETMYSIRNKSIEKHTIVKKNAQTQPEKSLNKQMEESCLHDILEDEKMYITMNKSIEEQTIVENNSQTQESQNKEMEESCILEDDTIVHKTINAQIIVKENNIQDLRKDSSLNVDVNNSTKHSLPEDGSSSDDSISWSPMIMMSGLGTSGHDAINSKEESTKNCKEQLISMQENIIEANNISKELSNIIVSNKVSSDHLIDKRLATCKERENKSNQAIVKDSTTKISKENIVEAICEDDTKHSNKEDVSNPTTPNNNFMIKTTIFENTSMDKSELYSTPTTEEGQLKTLTDISIENNAGSQLTGEENRSLLLEITQNNVEENLLMIPSTSNLVVNVSLIKITSPTTSSNDPKESTTTTNENISANTSSKKLTSPATSSNDLKESTNTLNVNVSSKTLTSPTTSSNDLKESTNTLIVNVSSNKFTSPTTSSNNLKDLNVSSKSASTPLKKTHLEDICELKEATSSQSFISKKQDTKRFKLGPNTKNIFEDSSDDHSFNLSQDLDTKLGKKKMKEKKFKAPFIEGSQNQSKTKGKRVMKTLGIKPLSKQQIKESYFKRDLYMIENQVDCKEYSKEILNRPNLRQIKGTQQIAIARKTKDGTIVIPTIRKEIKSRKRKFMPPLKQQLSVGKQFDASFFSDDNAKVYDEFISTKNDSEFDFNRFERKPIEDAIPSCSQFNFKPIPLNLLSPDLFSSPDSKQTRICKNDGNFSTPEGFYKRNKQEMNNIMDKYLKK